MREVTISRGLVVRNPFPGLRPFRPDEEHLFFGRESQVDRMIDKLAAHRFLAVVGSSGCGKSSLVNCGLRPALHRGYMARAGAAWRMAQLRPGSDPFEALAIALARPGVLFGGGDSGSGQPAPDAAMVEATLRLGSLGLVDIVEQARLPAGTQLLLVIDQFEELFRYRQLAADAAADAAGPGADSGAFGPGADATAFVRLLLEARAQTEVPVHVVLTMRSDFLGDCAQFHGLPEAINDGQYLVPRMVRDDIRAAITGPVEVAGASISPLLLTRLLNDVGDNPDQLSILQHALNRTWAYWENGESGENDGSAEAPLDLPHYEAIGTMAHALDQHAEKAFGELGTPQRRRIGERVFKALTDKGTDVRGIRRPTRLDALCAIVGAPADAVSAVLATFRRPSRSFLMPPLNEAMSAESVVDISHESLMRVWQRLRAWADEEAAAARVYRRLRESAALHEAGQAGLWRDPDLRLALDWRRRNAPTAAWAEQYRGGFDSAMAFLDRSRAVQDRIRVDAEIEHRWQAGWHYLPLAVVAAQFVLLQLFLADSLHQWLAASAEQRLIFDSGAGRWLLEGLSHLLAGVPAALVYVLLAPWAKQRFAQRLRAQLQPAGDDGPAAPPSAEDDERAEGAVPAAPAVDLRAPNYAGFWQRGAAMAIDSALLMAIALVVAMVLSGVALLVEGGQRAGLAAVAASAPVAALTSTPADEALGLLLFAVWLLTFWLYHARAWAGTRQATPGMRLMGLFVVDLHGRRLKFPRASGRHFARFLSYYTLGYGFLMQPFNVRRQTLHDRLAGTLVLRGQPPAPSAGGAEPARAAVAGKLAG